MPGHNQESGCCHCGADDHKFDECWLRSAVFCGTTNADILSLPEALQFDNDKVGKELHEAFQAIHSTSIPDEAGVQKYRKCAPDALPQWVDVPTSKTFWSASLRESRFLPKVDHIMSAVHRTDARLMEMYIPVVI